MRLAQRASLNVRFTPKATDLLRRRKMTRCATSGPWDCSTWLAQLIDWAMLPFSND
jgi:hypothetical protein